MSITYIGGAVLILAIGLTLFQLAREWPSAGGYFTYVSRAIHPRAGMMVGWVYLIYDPLIPGVCGTIVGYLVQTELQAHEGIDFPWWISTAIFIVVTTFLGWKGIKISGHVLVGLTFTELAILLSFAVSGFFNTGPGGFTMKPFTVDPRFGIHGLALGVVYVIFAYAGFESAAPLGEESRNPSKYVPWAIVGAIGIMTAFFVVAWWGLINGWGIANFDRTFAGQPVGAFYTLAQRYWGGAGWIIITLVLINSVFGICMSSVLYNSRMYFGMGRTGVLPTWLGRVSHQLPRNAIYAQAVVALAWAYAIAGWLGPSNAYFWTGLLITFSPILIFSAGAIGVFWHWFMHRRSEFNVFWHLLVPLVAVGGCGLTTYYSLPDLTGPYFWTLPIVACWIAAGILLLVWFHVTKREEWLLKSTQYAFEHKLTEEELAELDRQSQLQGSSKSIDSGNDDPLPA